MLMGGSIPIIVFKQNSSFTYFIKLIWSRATSQDHFRKDPVSQNGWSVCRSTVLEEYFNAVPRPLVPWSVCCSTVLEE